MLTQSVSITFFNSFILPLFDNGDTTCTWGDRDNSALMAELHFVQVLQKYNPMFATHSRSPSAFLCMQCTCDAPLEAEQCAIFAF